MTGIPDEVRRARREIEDAMTNLRYLEDEASRSTPNRVNFQHYLHRVKTALDDADRYLRRLR